MLPVQHHYAPEQEAAMRMSVADASENSQVTSSSARTRDFESAREESPSTSEDSATVTLQLLAPPFPVNSAAGLCGPILLGANAYGQLQQVGQGSFGRVIHAAVLHSGEPVDVAIKLLPRGQQIHQYASLVRREILHQTSLYHPFIVSLREVFLTPTHLAIAMEYAPAGDLYHHLLFQHSPSHCMSEEKARWMFQQLIIGLDYCHRRGVANRDLKLENLLLTYKAGWSRPLLKICDFGYSKHELGSPAKTCVGTLVYMAPEIILGGKHYDAKKADLWSCGVILYTMLYGRHPFDASNKQYARKVVSGDYTIPASENVSAECVALIRQLLNPCPEQRIPLSEILQQPWFRTALPSGALAMNDFYCNFSVPLDQYMEKVEKIIVRASAAACPGEDCSGMFAVVPNNSFHKV